MTYAQEIAREHVAHRDAEGLPWAAIAAEADMCCLLSGAPSVAALRPYEQAPAWAVERAYALAWEADQRRVLAA